MRYSLQVKAIAAPGGVASAGAGAGNPALMNRPGTVPMDEGRDWSGDLYEEGEVSDPAEAYAHFGGGEDTEAWLDRNPDGTLTGWVRAGADVWRYSDAEAWALDVDGAQMQRADEASPEANVATGEFSGEPQAPEPDPEAEADAALHPEGLTPEGDEDVDADNPFAAAVAEAVDAETDAINDEDPADDDEPFAEDEDPDGNTEVLTDDDGNAVAPEDEEEDPDAAPVGDFDSDSEDDTDEDEDEESDDDVPDDNLAGNDDVDADSDDEPDDEDSEDDEDEDEDGDETEADRLFKKRGQKKHMSHDQSSHGNWTDGLLKKPKRKSPDTFTDTGKGSGRHPKGGEPKKGHIDPKTLEHMSQEELDTLAGQGDLYDLDTARSVMAEMDRRDDMDSRVRDLLGDSPTPAEKFGAYDAVIPEGMSKWVADGAKGKVKTPKRNKRREAEEAYDQFVYDQYQRAVDTTNGQLFKPKYRRESPVDEIALFDGRASRAQVRKYGSEELLRFFADNPRLTFAEFAADELGWASFKKQRDRVQSDYLSEHG